MDYYPLPIGTKVTLHNEYADKNLDRKGTVMGHAFKYKADGSCYAVYLVDLDQGFYSEDQDMFVGTITCAPDVVRPID